MADPQRLQSVGMVPILPRAHHRVFQDVARRVRQRALDEHGELAPPVFRFKRFHQPAYPHAQSGHAEELLAAGRADRRGNGDVPDAHRFAAVCRRERRSLQVHALGRFLARLEVDRPAVEVRPPGVPPPHRGGLRLLRHARDLQAPGIVEKPTVDVPAGDHLGGDRGFQGGLQGPPHRMRAEALAQGFELLLRRIGVAQLLRKLNELRILRRLEKRADQLVGLDQLLDRAATPVDVGGNRLGRGARGELVRFQCPVDQFPPRPLDCGVEPAPNEERNDQEHQRRAKRAQDHRGPAGPAGLSGVERVKHRLHVRVALLRVRRQAPLDDLRQGAIHPANLPMLARRSPPADQGPVLGKPFPEIIDPVEPPHGRFVAVRRTTGQHRVEKGSEGIDVPASVGHGLEIGLFRRHVKERAQGRRLLAEQPRLAEIRQPRLLVLVEQDVARLQVAVEHALAVGVYQADRHVADDRHGFGAGERPRLEPIGQRAVLHVLHHVVRRLRVPADPDQLDNVAVGE